MTHVVHLDIVKMVSIRGLMNEELHGVVDWDEGVVKPERVRERYYSVVFTRWTAIDK